MTLRCCQARDAQVDEALLIDSTTALDLQVRKFQLQKRHLLTLQSGTCDAGHPLRSYDLPRIEALIGKPRTAVFATRFRHLPSNSTSVAPSSARDALRRVGARALRQNLIFGNLPFPQPARTRLFALRSGAAALGFRRDSSGHARWQLRNGASSEFLEHFVAE